MSDTREFYTHGHSPPVMSTHARRTAADSAQFLLPNLSPGLEVLDFGCGPGSITADLAAYVSPGGRVVGVDASADALAAASRNHKPSNTTYVQASVYDLPFPDESFDVAYGHQILQHLADPVSALVEVRRVLRPGGVVGVRDGDYGSMVHYPHYPELDQWRAVYQKVARDNGGEPDAGRRLHEWVTAAGFTQITATVSSWSYTTSEERAELARSWADRILVRRFRERVEALDAAVDMRVVADTWLRWAEEPAGWFAMLHGEVIATRQRPRGR